jgi:hypothetical protein
VVRPASSTILTTVRRALLWCAVIFPLGAIGATLFVEDWPARRFLLFYLAPLFAIGPLWVRLRLGDTSRRFDLIAGIDAAVFVFSVARFLSGTLLPFSGHMLFLTYSAIVTNRPSYRIIALLLLCVTTWFKLALWRDQASWGIGLVLGFILGVAALLLERESERPTPV